MFLREDSNQRATLVLRRMRCCSCFRQALSPGGIYTPYFLLSVSYCH